MKKSPLLYPFCQKFLDFTRGVKSNDTQRIYAFNLERFLDKFDGLRFNEISSEAIDVFISSMVNKDNTKSSNRTKNMMRSTLNVFFAKAVSWGYLTTTPMKGIKMLPEACVGTRPLNKQELEQLLDEASPLQLSYIQIVILSGIRAKSLRNLKFSDIDWDNNRIKVANKGGDHYFVSMNSELKSILSNLLKLFPNPKFGSNKKKDMIKYFPRSEIQKEYVFCHKDGRPYKKGFRSLEKLYKKFGITNVALHGLRKTFCTILAQNNVHPKVAQQLMGHKTPAMTMKIYTYVGSDQLKNAVNSLPSIL